MNKGARSRAHGAANAARPQPEWMTHKDRQRADRQATLDAMTGPLRKPTDDDPTADDAQTIEVEYRRVPD